MLNIGTGRFLWTFLVGFLIASNINMVTATCDWVSILLGALLIGFLQQWRRAG